MGSNSTGLYNTRRDLVYQVIPGTFIEEQIIRVSAVTARDFQVLAARICISKPGHLVTFSFVFNGIVTNNH